MFAYFANVGPMRFSIRAVVAFLGCPVQAPLGRVCGYIVPVGLSPPSGCHPNSPRFSSRSRRDLSLIGFVGHTKFVISSAARACPERSRRGSALFFIARRRG